MLIQQKEISCRSRSGVWVSMWPLLHHAGGLWPLTTATQQAPSTCHLYLGRGAGEEWVIYAKINLLAPGCQEIKIFCRFSASASAATTSKKRRRGRHGHRRSAAAPTMCSAPVSTTPITPDPTRPFTPAPLPRPQPPRLSATTAPSPDYIPPENARKRQ